MRWLGLGMLSTLGNDHVHHRSCTSSENAAEEVEADDNGGSCWNEALFHILGMQAFWICFFDFLTVHMLNIRESYFLLCLGNAATENVRNKSRRRAAAVLFVAEALGLIGYFSFIVIIIIIFQVDFRLHVTFQILPYINLCL